MMSQKKEEKNVVTGGCEKMPSRRLALIHADKEQRLYLCQSVYIRGSGHFLHTILPRVFHLPPLPMEYRTGMAATHSRPAGNIRPEL
jgi:hypothetical protein